MSLRCLSLVVVAVAVAGGCGQKNDESAASASTGGGSSGAGGADGSAPCSAGDLRAHIDPSQIPAGWVCIESANGRVLDENRSPLSSLLTSVCGAPACYSGTSDATGAFVVPIDVHIGLDMYAAAAHARPERAGFYWALPLDATGPTIDIGDLVVPLMPASGPDLVVKTDRVGAPAQTVTSGDITLDVAAGVLVELDVEEVAALPLGKEFRTLSIAEADRALYADPALGLVALYALAPFDASFVLEVDKSNATAQLSFVNAAGLPAGSAVDVLALGSYLDVTWVHPARFEPVATAHVSSDGTRIELDAGQGLRRLTWVGLREAR